MLYPTGAQIPFVAQFTTSQAGAPGLTVYVAIVRLASDGSRTVVISRASNTAATEMDATNQPGLYSYLLAGASTGTAGVYVATFHTAGTADLADIPALEIVGAAWVAHVDADVSSRASATDYTTARAAKLDNLDATVSSRLATSGYTAPDNADIATILTRTDVATSTRAPSGAPVTFVSPLTVDGAELTLVCGDDYGGSPAGLQRFVWTLAAGQYPDLTGGSVALYLAGAAGAQGTGTVVTGSATGAQTVAVDFTTTQTAAYLAPADTAFTLVVTTASGKQQSVVPAGTMYFVPRASS